MPQLTGMTLAICTRNRPDDLARCIAAIARQSAYFPLEVMVVDDGDLSPVFVRRLERQLRNGGEGAVGEGEDGGGGTGNGSRGPREGCEGGDSADGDDSRDDSRDPRNGGEVEAGSVRAGSAGIALTYCRKQEPGLLRSRLLAAERAAHDVILFVDDDAELAPGYLERLAAWYERHPQAAGVGGIDRNLRTHWRWELFTRLFLYASRDPGRLSPSSYGGSMTRWGAMRRPFRTEYMLGCNMSFRKRALVGLKPAEWLQGYSVGEDLYLSDHAMRSGDLWIDPALQVDHRHSPASRDRDAQVAYTEIVNHHHLLKLKQAGIARHAAHLWTSLGLLARAWARKRWRHRATAYRKAIRFVLAEEWRRLTRESVSNHGHG